MVNDFGFGINSAIVLYFILKRIFCTPRNTPKSLLALLYLASFVQFVWLTVIRFIQQGRVCSGDYKGYVYDPADKTKRTEKYDGYFLEVEGRFFWWYSVSIISLIGFVAFMGCFGVWAFSKWTARIVDYPLIQRIEDTEYYTNYTKKEAKKAYKGYQDYYQEHQDVFKEAAQ